jgi:hypothetical protein
MEVVTSALGSVRPLHQKITLFPPATTMPWLKWLRSPQQAEAGVKAGGAEEPLLAADAESAAGQNGQDTSSDAAVLSNGYDVHSTEAPVPADSAAVPGKRRMSPFAWLLLAAAVSDHMQACSPVWMLAHRFRHTEMLDTQADCSQQMSCAAKSEHPIDDIH